MTYNPVCAVRVAADQTQPNLSQGNIAGFHGCCVVWTHSDAFLINLSCIAVGA